MTPEEARQKSRGISTDMSPEAIARRLDIVSQLFRLGHALNNAEYVGKVRDVRSPGVASGNDQRVT